MDGNVRGITLRLAKEGLAEPVWQRAFPNAAPYFRPVVLRPSRQPELTDRHRLRIDGSITSDSHFALHAAVGKSLGTGGHAFGSTEKRIPPRSQAFYFNQVLKV